MTRSGNDTKTSNLFSETQGINSDKGTPIKLRESDRNRSIEDNSNTKDSSKNSQLADRRGVHLHVTPESSPAKKDWMLRDSEYDLIPDESNDEHPSPSHKLTPSKGGVHTPYMGKWSKLTEASKNGHKLPDASKVMNKYVNSVPVIAQAQPSPTYSASSNHGQFDIYNYIRNKEYKTDHTWHTKDAYFHEMFRSLSFAKMATTNSPSQKKQTPTSAKNSLFNKSRRNCNKNYKRVIMLDLDETLVRAEPLNSSKKYSQIISVKVTPSQSQNFGIMIRPFTSEFLDIISKEHKIIVYTASVEEYAEKIVQVIDPQRKFIDQVLSREHCAFVGGLFVKDLEIAIHREISLDNVIIIDNYVHSYALHLDQGIPIKPFYGDMSDKELMILADVIHQSTSYPRLLDFMKTHLDFTDFYDFLERNQAAFDV